MKISYFKTMRRVLLNSAEKGFFYPKANVSGRMKTQKKTDTLVEMEERRLFEEPVYAGADLGGGGSSFLGDSTPCRPKGSPFVLFWDIGTYIFGISDYFGITDPTNFLREPWALIYTDFEGVDRAQKRPF